MTETPQDNAPDLETTSGQEAPPEQDGGSGPETEADAREREIQRRLTQQGRENAELRRQMQAAQQASVNQINELQSTVRLLAEKASADQRAQAEAQQRQFEAELASLPPADRLERRIEILQGQINTLRQPAVQPAQPVPQQHPPAQREPTDDERAAYMEKRVREIVAEASTEFGVSVNLDQIPDGDWESEETFYRSVMKQAAQSSRTGGGNEAMPAKKAETPAQMRDRIRQEERERLGANSPAAPRAASATSSRKKAADEADVRAAAQAYDSKLGPKANLKRMQELRSTMG